MLGIRVGFPGSWKGWKDEENDEGWKDEENACKVGCIVLSKCYLQREKSFN